MSSKKRFSIGWFTGIVLGVASSTAVVYAVTVPNTFTAGTSALASAVNANFTALKNAVDALEAGTSPCSTGMTRVGAACVDNARAAASVTWNDAVNACRTAGKRLMTAGEYIAAKNAGTVVAANGEFEWVDTVFSNGSAGGSAGRLTAGYIGPSDGVNIPTVPAGEIFFATNAAYDAGFSFIYYRCAR